MDDRQRWIDAAWAALEKLDVAAVLTPVVEIPSPTGQERALAEHLAEHLTGAGLEGHCQVIDDLQANAWGRLQGSGEGPHLMLYAPIDTLFSEEDLPWLGPALPPDMSLEVRTDGDEAVGRGAENPKGYVTAILLAAEALARAGVPLRGDLVVALGAGGMPTNPRPGGRVRRQNTGNGTGCAYLLEQGVRADFAVICKPGWAVACEEVGLSWHRVEVRGEVNYTGIRHRIPYRNPILMAATVMQELEAWFPQFTRRNASGEVAPQGSIGAIEGGWPHKPAFVPAACRFYVDLRLSPRTDAMQVKHQLDEVLACIQGAHPGIDVRSEMILALPGSRTDPENWIVRSCIAAWERVTGQPHQRPSGTSGATDAAILRGWGIPTARLGMPRGPGRAVFCMDRVSQSGIRQLARCLVAAAVDTCTRTRQEVGLPS